MTSIIIPKSVKSIAYKAFSGVEELTTIYYCGTASDWWSGMRIDSDAFSYDSKYTVYYSETQPTTAGNYWRYVNGVPTVW